MPIRAVVYASSAGEAITGDRLGLSNGKLDQIVDDAARFNRNAGVTGCFSSMVNASSSTWRGLRMDFQSPIPACWARVVITGSWSCSEAGWFSAACHSGP